jgi:hypothetical protein
MGLPRHGFLAILILISSADSVAQDAVAAKHVNEILAEYHAKYPQGPADSGLCKRARGQSPPYSSFRIREVNPATLEKNLSTLMEASDDVVLGGTLLREAMVLTPSGENAVTYTDFRVLHVWKGTYKAGDLLTVGTWFGFVGPCGPGAKAMAGTQVGPVPEWMLYPDGPADAGAVSVLFLQRDRTGEMESLRLTGGGGVQGMFVLPLPKLKDLGSPSAACYTASFDRLACQTYYELVHRKIMPEWCRDREPAVDQGRIEACNEVVSNLKEPVTAPGLAQDPLRERYKGMPVASFLKEVQTIADSFGHASSSASK